MRLRDWLAGCGGEFRTLVEPLDEALNWLISIVGRSESFFVLRHACRGYAGVVLVEILYEVHDGPRGVAVVLIFQRG